MPVGIRSEAMHVGARLLIINCFHLSSSRFDTNPSHLHVLTHEGYWYETISSSTLLEYPMLMYDCRCTVSLGK